jgi:hypothetical protein
MFQRFFLKLIPVVGLLVGSFMAQQASASQYQHSEAWTQMFPRAVRMEIGGVNRVLIREYENPEVEAPESVGPPLQYVDCKKAKGLPELNKTSYELVFDHNQGAWYRDGVKMSLKDFSAFTEGMRYIWTREFKLLSGTGGHHATFDNGDYALCAGTLHFDDDGLIARLDNGTGHMCAHTINLFHMVTDLQRMGAIAPYCRIMNYKGEMVSPADMLNYEIDPEYANLLLVETPETVIAAYRNRFDRVALVRHSDGVTRLSQIVFEVLTHTNLEINARGGPAGVGDVDEVKLAALIQSRPHPGFYDKVLELRQHAFRISWTMMESHSGGVNPPDNEQEKQAAKLSARERLNRMIDTRPHPELYDAILGTPVMPEYKD